MNLGSLTSSHYLAPFIAPFGSHQKRRGDYKPVQVTGKKALVPRTLMDVRAVINRVKESIIVDRIGITELNKSAKDKHVRKQRNVLGLWG